MESFTFLLLFTILISTILHFLTLIFRRPRRAAANLPPGPPPLPIIGNLHQIGQNPHHTLTRFAETYGPIIHLKLGCLDTVVVSSPALAKQVLQKHDQALSSRHLSAISGTYGHDKASILWLPTNNARWRTLRRICKDQMFSLQRLDSSQGLRQQKLTMLRDYVRESCDLCRVLDISDIVFTTSLNLISGSLFSVDLADFNSSDSSQEVKGIIHGLMHALTAPNVADFFPFLKPFDPQKLVQKSYLYAGKAFRIFEGIIDQRLKSGSSVDSNDLLKALLDISRVDESEFSRNDMLHLLLDLFVAGTDSTATTVEWAMAELMQNPKEMSKARNELHTIIGKGQQVQESDISKLPYLQAVLKETFRLHPPGPLLLPHKAVAESEIGGFIIPEKAQVMVNVWAMGRDPGIWTDPDCFRPGRFLGSKIDVRGQDFELIPFSSGRRMCPALPFAYRTVNLLVAALIQEFDWKLEGGMRPEEINMNDRFESTLKRVQPLRAIPVRI